MVVNEYHTRCLSMCNCGRMMKSTEIPPPSSVDHSRKTNRRGSNTQLYCKLSSNCIIGSKGFINNYKFDKASNNVKRELVPSRRLTWWNKASLVIICKLNDGFLKDQRAQCVTYNFAFVRASLSVGFFCLFVYCRWTF